MQTPFTTVIYGLYGFFRAVTDGVRNWGMPQNAPKLPSWGEAPNRSFRLAVDWTCWTHRNTFWSPQNQTSWDYSSLFIKRSFQIPLLFGEFQLRFSSTYPFLCTSEGSFTNVTARGPLTGVLLIRSTCEKMGWW